MTGSALREIWRGMTGRSWVATGGAIVVCVCIYGALAVAITPAWFINHPARFMADRDDVYPWIKAAALRVAADARPERTYRVVLVGDSGIREAITSVEDLRRRIAEQTHRPFELVPLLAGGLTQLDAVDLCGAMEGHLKGQVVLEVSPFWMAKAYNASLLEKVTDRIGLDSPRLSDALATAGFARPTWRGNFFLRNIRFMLSRTDAFVHFTRRYPQPGLHNLGRVVQSERAFNTEAAMVFKMLHGVGHRAPEHEAIYEQMVNGLQRPDVSVSLLEAPLNPRLRSADDAKIGMTRAVLAMYLHARAALSHRAHAMVWDLNGRCKFQRAEFADAFHLDRDSARVRFTRALAVRIATQMNADRNDTQ